jgi:hypothetical protein
VKSPNGGLILYQPIAGINADGAQEGGRRNYRKAMPRKNPGDRECGLLLPRNEKKKILDDRHERLTEEKFRGKTNDAESGDQQDQKKYDSAEF